MTQECLICDQTFSQAVKVDFLLYPVKHGQYDSNFINNYDHIKGGYVFQKSINMCSECRDAWLNFNHEPIADGYDYTECIDSMKFIINETIEKYL